jgi:hypothetical protein
MPVRICPVTIVTGGVSTPIRMASFPSMKTINPPWFSHNPDIAGSQIVILVAHESDIFVAIPYITVRNPYHDCWCRCHIHRWWSRIHDWLRRNDYGFERHAPIRLDHATRH